MLTVFQYLLKHELLSRPLRLAHYPTGHFLLIKMIEIIHNTFKQHKYQMQHCSRRQLRFDCSAFYSVSTLPPPKDESFTNQERQYSVENEAIILGIILGSTA